MASENRPSDNLVERIAPIAKDARRSSFFALVSLLERLVPDGARIGGDGPTDKETLRFTHDPSLAFQAGDVSSVQIKSIGADPNDPYAKPRTIVQVMSTFLGLTGASSPLPSYFAEEILHDGDDSRQREFLDIFHHRALSLLYRGVARHSPKTEHTSDTGDIWVQRFLALGGIDSQITPHFKGPYAGRVLSLLPRLVGRSRSSGNLQAALEVMLQDQLEENGHVRIQEFLHSWMDLGPEQRTQLGRANHALGRSLVLGERVPERTGRFAIRIGPLSEKGYRAFLPGGDALEIVKSTVKLFTRHASYYDVELELDETAIPNFKLSSHRGAQLGRGTWLQGKPSARLMTIPQTLE